MTQKGITQRVWLFLLEHGGHWTAAELAENTGASTAHMDRIIWSMCDVGSVTKRRSGYRKNGIAFGVNAACRIPQGITLRDIAKAQEARQIIEAPRDAANQPIARPRAFAQGV
jgi:hypothetical protein